MISRRNILKTSIAAAFIPLGISASAASAGTIDSVLYSTGFPDLDAAIGGGLRIGSVNIICGQVGTYKTALQSAIRDNIWKSEKVSQSVGIAEIGKTGIECGFVGIADSLCLKEIDYEDISARNDIAISELGQSFKKMAMEKKAIRK